MLHHGKRYLPLTTVQSMYRSIIEPHFRFCYLVVWGVCNATAVNKQLKLQNHASRMAIEQLLGCAVSATSGKSGMANCKGSY